MELTEREAVEDLDRLRASLAILKRHGVRIAADDVGAGNAGLRLLSEVDFDIIKIDLSLVRAGARHEPSEAVLRALQEMARQRNQTVVAEGVETPELLESVLELGFEYGQGYLLGRPATCSRRADPRAHRSHDRGRAARRPSQPPEPRVGSRPRHLCRVAGSAFGPRGRARPAIAGGVDRPPRDALIGRRMLATERNEQARLAREQGGRDISRRRPDRQASPLRSRPPSP